MGTKILTFNANVESISVNTALLEQCIAYLSIYIALVCVGT